MPLTNNSIYWITIGIICIVNVLLASYIGRRGRNWFINTGPVGMILFGLCICMLFWVKYAQDNYGFTFRLVHSPIVFAPAIIALILGAKSRGSD